MSNMLFFGQMAQLAYAFPLAVTISLVYSATRFEQFDSIIMHTVKSLLWFGGFCLAVFLVLRWLTYPL